MKKRKISNILNDIDLIGNEENSRKQQSDESYCCYILTSCVTPGRKYVGITNDRKNRVRKHNGEIKGGAKSTTAHRPWRMAAIIDGFSKTESLRFEWSMHNPRKRRLLKPHRALVGGLNCARQLLQSRWKTRFTNEKIDVILQNDLVVQGTHIQLHSLLNSFTDCENCKIVSAPGQLRMYVAHDENICLSQLSRLELEQKYCVNHE